MWNYSLQHTESGILERSMRIKWQIKYKTGCAGRAEFTTKQSNEPLKMLVKNSDCKVGDFSKYIREELLVSAVGSGSCVGHKTVFIMAKQSFRHFIPTPNMETSNQFTVPVRSRALLSKRASLFFQLVSKFDTSFSVEPDPWPRVP